jgi:hypothetical protein
MSDYQRHASVAKTAEIHGKVAKAAFCTHSKKELKSLYECKNVAICLLFTYNP